MRLLTDHAVFPITHMVTYLAVRRIYRTVQSVTHQSVGTEPMVLCESVSKVSRWMGAYSVAFVKRLEDKWLFLRVAYQGGIDVRRRLGETFSETLFRKQRSSKTYRSRTHQRNPACGLIYHQQL